MTTLYLTIFRAKRSSIIEPTAKREHKSRLSERENELASPVLSDTPMISDVHPGQDIMNYL